MSHGKLQQRIAEKKAILDALINDLEHPDRFLRRIREFDEQIAALQTQRDHIAFLNDNLAPRIEAVKADLEELYALRRAYYNAPLAQLEKLKTQYEALLASLTPDQRDTLRSLELPE